MRLKDKVSIITGSANGIGLATAAKFAQEGAIVIVCDLNAEKVDSCVRQIESTGGRAHGYVTDITDRESIKLMVDSVKETYERIDVLVNNAGITKDAKISTMSESDFDTVINVNLKGTFNCAQAVIETMSNQGSGSIINASSISGVYGNFGQSNYAASKAGVIGLGKTWARELGPKGIRVNTVVPGSVATDILSTVPEKVLESIKSKCWLRRIGAPEEIANVYAFLASDESSYINGTTIEVSGGVSI